MENGTAAGHSDQVTPEKSLFYRYESQVQSYARAMPALFTKAVGSEIWDKDGRRYLDFLAGAGSLNYGHNNPVLKSALLDYIAADGITHSLDLHTEAKENFLVELNETLLAPRGLDYVAQFTGPTGTNAVEAALKLARKLTGRTNIVHFTNSFHGVSLGSLAVTSNETLRGAAGVPLSGATCMPYDRYFGDNLDTTVQIEKLLVDKANGIELPAAMILEVVQGEGGLNAARSEWLQRIEALCRSLDILLIVDDIQAGCGRTGTFFSFEPSGIKPDIVTVSKSLSGFGLPFSLVLVKRELDQWKPGEHNGTFRGNNHAFVTSAAMIRHYWRTDDFARMVRARAEELGVRLQALADRHIGDLVEVKGRGLMAGVRFADPDKAGAVATRAFERGLICERCGPSDEVVKCMMPIVISADELSEGLDILDAATSDVLGAGSAAGGIARPRRAVASAMK